MPGNGVSDHYRGEGGAAYFKARQADLDHPGYADNARYFAPYLEKSDRVLDFGCGNGGMLPHLEAMAAEAEGLEVNETARQNVDERFKVHASLEDLGAVEPYDVVVSNHVLEHISNASEVLATLRGRIRPGGRFVTKLPYDDIRTGHQRRWSRDDADHHVHTWTPRLFANLLFEAGYEVEQVRVVTSAWPPRVFGLLIRLRIHRPIFRAFAVLTRRRQILAVGRVPSA